MKIAITGTHGTGKTTLSYYLAGYYKSLGKSVKIIQEVTRSCPFPINQRMTIEAAKWIYLEHTKKELEASKNQVIIGDRSVYDSFAYSDYFKFTDDEFLLKLKKMAIDQLSSYDKLIFVRPDLPIHEDGVRCSDNEFQKGVDSIFEKNLKNKRCIEINSSQIFDMEQSWKKYCV